jgi:proteasome lid subunit RPN8/RPN11
MLIEVTSGVLEQISSHANSAHPDECCGLLLGDGSIISQAHASDNLAASPARHFELDPQDLIDAHRMERSGGPRVMGYYHSHPNGPARPSATDRVHASGDRRVWAIAGQDGITFWLDGEQGFEALSCKAIDG